MSITKSNTRMLDGSISDTQLASGVGTSANNLVKLDGTAKLPAVDGSQLTNVSAGKLLQVKNFQTGAYNTGTTAIPYDTTIPQITEGKEFMTLAFTPTSATNKLRIEVLVNGASTSNDCSIALFVGTTANALNCGVDFTGNNERQQFALNHYMDAGSTSELTFRVRAGGSTAGTFYFNGNSAGTQMGGTLISSITITEIAS